MSVAPSWTPRPEEAPREFLVERASAPVRFDFAPLLLLGGAVYAALAWLAPYTRQSNTAVLILTDSYSRVRLA